jgi:hypothetical protein
MSVPGDAELIALYDALEYVGFSSVDFRASLVNSGWTAGDVAKAIAAYLSLGNNAFQLKRIQRARDAEKAREISVWLNSKAVKKGASEGNPVTLGRIAKAYAPAVLALRKTLGPRLRLQVETRTPIEQADIAFLGYDRMALCKDSVDYVEKFGLIISKVNPAFAKLSDDEILRRNRGFAEIARRGLESDVVMTGLLNRVKPASLADCIKVLHAVKPSVPTRPPGAAGSEETEKI